MIEYPDLEIRNEDQLAAEAISRTSGGLTETIVRGQIREREEILKLIEAGLDAPICPELTNANPSAPHTVLLEAMAWSLGQQANRFNKVPQQNFIAFANLFGISPRAATAAETILEFTVDPPPDTDVTIPEGTQISDAAGKYVFETAEDLTIVFDEEAETLSGSVLARRTVAGHTLLSPDVITSPIDNVGFVESITNPDAIDSGTELETLESTLERVKRYTRRGERIVSTKDLEEAILEEALEGNGVVRAFPFVINGEFIGGQLTAGHTTVIVMTKTGDKIDSLTMARIGGLLEQGVGNQFIYVVDPFYIDFDVWVTIRINTGSPELAVLTAVENNLRNFYGPSREQFGRPILRSEIIAVIEGTAGVDRIEVIAEPGKAINQTTPILHAPLVDTKLLEFQLARLVDVIIDVV